MSDAANALPDEKRDERGQARFANFEVDLRSGELRRDGLRVKLQEQPFRLLTLLIHNAGEVVTREELRTKLWRDEFVDFDHGLNAAVRKLRSALDDAAGEPRFIETLARRGYRFIAPVQWSTTDVRPAPRRVRRIPWLAIAIATFVVVAAVVALLLVRQRTFARQSINAIAVLPFASGRTERERVVGEGVAEVIIDSLSRLPNLRVMSRTTSFRFNGDSDPVKVARDLNVRALVTGRILREGDQYTIRIELIDGNDGSQIWGDRFTGRADQLQSLQREISDELSLRLRRGVDRELVAKTKTTNPKAYDMYLWGLYAYNRRTAANLEQALKWFDAAVAADPQFASAHAGIANVYGVMIGYGLLSPEEGTPKVLSAARRALELDPDNAEALTSIASSEFRNLWDFDGAERDYRRALALNPNYATAHHWFSHLLRSRGHVEEANQQMDMAYKLDPFSAAINAGRVCGLYFDRRYDEAIALGRALAAVDKDLVFGRCYGAAFAAKGDFEGLVGVLQQLAPPEVSKPMIEAYRRGGRRAFFEMRLARLLKRRDAETSAPVEIAGTYAQLGNVDAAFQWLERGFKHRVSTMVDIGFNPELDPIRNDPRLAELLRRIGLPVR